MLRLIQAEFLKLRRKKFIVLMLLSALFMPLLAVFYFRSADKTVIEPLQFYKWTTFSYTAINEQISNFAQTYPTNLKASSNEALLFMRRYRFANCSCFSCCFKDAYPSSNVQ